MARNWGDTNAVREDIEKRMALYGENIAPIPYSEYCELRSQGRVWVVDIHVKVRRVIEFELTGEGPTIADALRSAYLALNNEPVLRRNAAQTNATFGVAY